MRKVRQREVKQLTRGHTPTMRQPRLNVGSNDSEAQALNSAKLPLIETWNPSFPEDYV